MSWQDVVIALGQALFALALGPSIFTLEKPHRWTCFMTGATLWLFAWVYLTLDMILSVMSVSICAILWTILLFQSRREER